MRDAEAVAGGFTRGATGLPLCKLARSASWSRVQRGPARNEFANLPSPYEVALILLKSPLFSRRKAKTAQYTGGQKWFNNYPSPRGR